MTTDDDRFMIDALESGDPLRLEQMAAVRNVARRAIATGLAGTEYPGRVLPRQSHHFRAGLEARKLLDGGLLNTAILNVTALMEVKSAMGVFVAAPTAGSCGTYFGTLEGYGTPQPVSSDAYYVQRQANPEQKQVQFLRT